MLAALAVVVATSTTQIVAAPVAVAPSTHSPRALIGLVKERTTRHAVRLASTGEVEADADGGDEGGLHMILSKVASFRYARSRVHRAEAKRAHAAAGSKELSL